MKNARKKSIVKHMVFTVVVIHPHLVCYSTQDRVRTTVATEVDILRPLPFLWTQDRSVVTVTLLPTEQWVRPILIEALTQAMMIVAAA